MSPTESNEQRQAGRMRTRAVVFLLVALTAGALAVVLVRQYLASVQSAVARLEQPTQAVAVAMMDVPTATKLEAKHVKIVEWPTGSVPAGSFGKVEDLLNRVARQDMFAGEVLLKSKLLDEGEGQGLGSLLAPGLRAMAVQVDPVVGVAGFVHPGDYVDVISTMKPDEETNKLRREEAAWIARIVLQHVRVLAVGDQLSANATKAEKALDANVFTLAVTPEQSETLALASQYGKLQLSLRPRAEVQASATPGQSPAMLLAAGAPPPPAPMPEVVAAAPVSRARPKREPVEEEVKPVAPAAPVVEILRGTKVEERKLRASEEASAR